MYFNINTKAHLILVWHLLQNRCQLDYFTALSEACQILIYESDQKHGSIYNYSDNHTVKTNFRINLKGVLQLLATANKTSCENGQFDINQVSKGLILEDKIRQ